MSRPAHVEALAMNSSARCRCRWSPTQHARARRACRSAALVGESKKRTGWAGDVAFVGERRREGTGESNSTSALLGASAAGCVSALLRHRNRLRRRRARLGQGAATVRAVHHAQRGRRRRTTGEKQRTRNQSPCFEHPPAAVGAATRLARGERCVLLFSFKHSPERPPAMGCRLLESDPLTFRKSETVRPNAVETVKIAGAGFCRRETGAHSCGRPRSCLQQ